MKTMSNYISNLLITSNIAIHLLKEKITVLHALFVKSQEHGLTPIKACGCRTNFRYPIVIITQCHWAGEMDETLGEVAPISCRW